jgi:uncharacterized protein YacL
MKKVVAFISALFMFVLTWFISGMLIAVVWEYSRTEIRLGSLGTNIAGLIGLLVATLVATHTFRASLKAKTGKLYKKNKED